MTQKIPPRLQNPSNYPHLFLQDTQFGDLDSLGHANNLAVARFYESARVRLLTDAFGLSIFAPGNPQRIVLVESRASYLDEIHFPQSLQVKSAVSRLGNSSCVTQQAIFRADVCVGLCEAVLVNLVGKAPTPFSATERAEISKLMLGEVN